MYRAKNAGRNTFCIYDAQMSEAAATQLSTRLELRHAIDDGQFLLHYQPILEMPSRRVVGVEALVRWQHPRRGMVAPNDFIPLAEATGLILPLGDWILETACSQLAQWADKRTWRISMFRSTSARCNFARPTLPIRLRRS